MKTNPCYPSSRHEQLAYCREGTARRVQQNWRVRSALALRRQFNIDSDMLEYVEVFKYLGRMLHMHDEDRPAVRAELRKARACWNRIARVLDGKNASP